MTSQVGGLGLDEHVIQRQNKYLRETRINTQATNL